MGKSSIHAALPGSVVILGFGSIAQGTLPLLIRHIDIAPKRVTVVSRSAAGCRKGLM